MAPTALSAETWELVGTLFDQLAALPPNRRDLDTLDQPRSVRTLLEQMLAAHDTTDPQLLDRTVRAVAGGLLGDESDAVAVDYAGRTFGPWRALEEVGRGGMAVVLSGERADGRFEKEVAIKLLPHTGAGGMGDGVGHERLLEEIRILARLEHPNIARLIDGGITDDGVPYLVMEYVHGRPITDYCHPRNLDISGRVELFLQVCDAVLFAHRHLVVHCDIKPGNILVSEDGQVKLVDFGIAGLTSGGPQTERAPRGLFCSPAYAAPEQLLGEPPATSQDTFSLGAVLYELLCDQRVRDNPAATRLLFGIDTKPQAVVPPSQRTRKRRIDRDLDAICLKALAADPSERYANTTDLAADLNAWQQHQPVTARDAGAGYRTARWLRRHWLPATAATLLILALGAGLASTLWQAAQANRQATLAVQESQRATAVRDFLVGLFEATGPGVPRQEMPSLETLLETGVTQARDSAQAPALRADMLTVIGNIYRHSGQFERAEALFIEANELHSRPGVAATTAQRFELEFQRAMLAANRGDYAGAETALLVLLDSELGDAQPPQVLSELVTNLAMVKSLRDKHGEAIELYQRELMWLEPAGEESLIQRAHIRNNLAVALNRAGRTQEALAAFEIAVDESRAVYGPRHRQTAVTLSNMAIAARRLGDLPRAEQLLREAIEIDRQVFTEPHPELADKLNNLAVNLAVQDRYAEAQTAIAEAVAVSRQIFESSNPGLASKLRNLCAIERFLDHLAQAEVACREGLQNALASLGETHSLTAALQRNLAMTLLEKGELDEAEDLIRKSTETLAQVSGPSHPETILSLSVVAQVEGGQGRTEAARETLQQAIDLDIERGQPGLAPAIERQIQMLGLLRALGNTDEARKRLQSLEQTLSESEGLSRRIRAAFLTERAALQTATGAPELARADLEEALTLLRAIFPPEHGGIRMLQSELASLSKSASPATAERDRENAR